MLIAVCLTECARSDEEMGWSSYGGQTQSPYRRADLPDDDQPVSEELSPSKGHPRETEPTKVVQDAWGLFLWLSCERSSWLLPHCHWHRNSGLGRFPSQLPWSVWAQIAAWLRAGRRGLHIKRDLRRYRCHRANTDGLCCFGWSVDGKRGLD